MKNTIKNIKPLTPELPEPEKVFELSSDKHPYRPLTESWDSNCILCGGKERDAVHHKGSQC
jgi:hypothetical protein